jgi:hypothetical protein
MPTLNILPLLSNGTKVVTPANAQSKPTAKPIMAPSRANDGRNRAVDSLGAAASMRASAAPVTRRLARSSWTSAKSKCSGPAAASWAIVKPFDEHRFGDGLI